MLHISNQRLTEWKGNYSKFQAQHEADQSQRERAAELEQREIKRLSTLADSMRASTEKRAEEAKALDKRVERMEATRTQVDKREQGEHVQAARRRRARAPSPLEVAKLGVRYGSNEVLSDVTFHAGRGDHIVIIGRNGAGKSSLLRCLAGVQEPTNGVVELGANVGAGLLRPGARADRPDAARAGQRERRRAGKPRRTAGPSSARSACRRRRPTRCRPRSRVASGPSSGWPCSQPARPTCSCSTSRPTTSTPRPSPPSARMLGAWPGTIVAVSHERGFVEALRPTYCLRLPEERFTHWREEYLDDVEMR